jgi:cell wall associated hydrolase
MSGFNVADGTYMQWQTSESVLEKELKIGDIGIMKENGTGTYNHVGIYAGDGYWIHCNYSRNGVTLEKTNIFKYPRRFKNIKFDDDKQKDSTDKSNTITSDTSKSEVDKEMVKMIQIESNGKVPTVNAINKDSNYYVKLRDLDKLGLLKVDYNQATKRPIVNKVN